MYFREKFRSHPYYSKTYRAVRCKTDEKKRPRQHHISSKLKQYLDVNSFQTSCRTIFVRLRFFTDDYFPTAGEQYDKNFGLLQHFPWTSWISSGKVKTVLEIWFTALPRNRHFICWPATIILSLEKVYAKF